MSILFVVIFYKPILIDKQWNRHCIGFSVIFQ